LQETARWSDKEPTDNKLAFSQTKFDAVMQDIWDNAGSTSDAYSCYLSSFQMTKALGFTGMNSQRSTIPAKRGENMVVKDIDVYVTPWGVVNFVLSRENRSRDVFILRDDMWAVANLRGMKNEPLAKSGDSEKRQVLCELTLVSKNEKASGGIFDNSTS